jgi:chaperonin GroEL
VSNNYADVKPSPTGQLGAAALAALELDGIRREDNSPAPPRPAPRSNAVQGDDHRNAVRSALGEIASTVARTLGPHGSHALVRDSGGSHFATKDGYTVLRHMVFLQETATMVLDHVRSVSRTVVRRVGDGSTTAVVMADALYRSFDDAGLHEEFPPGAIQAAMSACAEAVSDCIREAARRPTRGDLARVATIAANNDPQAGALVAGIFGEHGESANVFVTTAPGDDTRVVPQPGFRILRGMAHDAFANTATADEAAPSICRLVDPHVLVWGGVVGMKEFVQKVMPAGNAILEKGRTFVVVAQGYSPEVLDAAAKFRLKSSSIGLLLVDHAMALRKSAARLGDLCSVLGAAYVDPEGLPEPKDPQEAAQMASATLAKCGTCSSVRSTISETVFVTTGVRNPAAVARAQELSGQIERVDTGNVAENMGEELDELRARHRALMGTEVTLQAGGATEQEKRALQYLLDDAALACKAAIRSGVVEGMGMTAVRAIRDPSRGALILRRVRDEIAARTRVGDPAQAERLAGQVVEATLTAYMRSFEKVLANARANPLSVAQACLARGESYDVLTGRFSPHAEAEVINPADTDVEILRGAMSIVAMFACSDQTLLTRVRSGPGHD